LSRSNPQDFAMSMKRWIAATCAVPAALAAAPVLAQATSFNTRMLINPSPNGAVSPRNNTSLQIISPTTDGAENNAVDVFSYNTASQIVLERYNWNGRTYTALRKGQTEGTLVGAALDGVPGNPGVGDPANAAIGFVATEDHTTSAQGTGIGFFYDPNGTTRLPLAMAISPGGLGGVTVGGKGGGAITSGPTDLGNGTLHAGDDIVSDSHLRTTSATHGQPSVPAPTCGGAGASLQEGTDQAGLVKVGAGAPTSSCVINFGHAWGAAPANNPICQVQPFGSNAVAAWVSAWSAGSLTVRFSANYAGRFSFICMGVS
jgi:hypothetical protein